MTKVSIKVISVILCAVMVVGCCFTGCGQRKVNDVTLTQLLETLKTQYPEAHIFTGVVYDDNGEIELGESTEIFLSDGCTGTYIGRFALSLSDCGNPDEYNTSEDLRSRVLQVGNIQSKNEAETILNIVMPLYFDDWDLSVTNKFLDFVEPDDSFTEWKNAKLFKHSGIIIDSYKGVHSYKGLSVDIRLD